ncbi:FAD/NAD(P)-binding domain-containing protein [Apiospora aurea]|uniref:FAD/NAD(P)-binding domain-containing protein n=1 Tax=Apiospora aurea TaxID=335848 RepID=A0ABR1PRW7_9PEZI
MMEPTPTKFRAIIVGAGPVGLYLAHAFAKANIDYIVLEQHASVHRDRGAGVLLYPQTLRLLDQIGLYEKIENDFIVNRTQREVLTGNGRVFKESPLWSMLSEQHTYPMAGLSRAQLIALLYENLPEKQERVKTRAAVLAVEAYEKGVKVRLQDGSTQEGSILLGVDGVHSKTRCIMQQLDQTPPDTWPMTATHHGLYGSFLPPASLNLEVGTFYQSRGTGVVSQIMIGTDRAHFSIVRPNSAPTAESKQYSKEDGDRLAGDLASIMVAPRVRFQAVWEAAVKETVALVDQEEGYCDKWYHERIVLVGDAVHKSTSVTGLGVSTGLNSAAVLANELYRVIQSDPEPSTRAIEDAFARYQKDRTFEASRLFDIGRKQVRGVTWQTWADWFWDRIVNPLDRCGYGGEQVRKAHQKRSDIGIRALQRSGSPSAMVP